MREQTILDGINHFYIFAMIGRISATLRHKSRDRTQRRQKAHMRRHAEHMSDHMRRDIGLFR